MIMGQVYYNVRMDTRSAGARLRRGDDDRGVQADKETDRLCLAEDALL